MSSTVLIVEDEHIAGMEIEEMLKDAGYEVSDIVDNASDAFDQLDENDLDLVLMDIEIPGELDGIDTAKKVQDEYGVPVVFLTAYSDDENLERAKATDPAGYLVKPVTEADLRSTLEIILDN